MRRQTRGNSYHPAAADTFSCNYREWEADPYRTALPKHTQSASTEDLVKFDKERISVIYNNLGGRRLHNVKYAQANAQMAMSKHVCPISDATPDPRQRQKGLT